jgi:hypothetical protein
MWFGLVLLALFASFFVNAARSQHDLPRQQSKQWENLSGRPTAHRAKQILAFSPYWMMLVSGVAVIVIAALLIAQL